MIDYARKIKSIIPDFDETLINASFQAARIDSMDLLTATSKNSKLLKII
jgi:hypothetical protein